MPTTEELRLDALTEAQDEEVEAAERAAAVAATTQLRAEIERIIVASIAAFEVLGEEADRSSLLRQIRERLTGVNVTVAAPLLDHYLRALRLGQRQAWAQLGIRRPRLRERITVTLTPELLDAANTAERRAAEALRDAAGRLAVVEDVRDLEDGLAVARRAVSRVEASASWGVNRAVATGVTAEATERGASRLWVGERDACVHCLAYFGEIAAPGVPFPAGLTFGDRALDVAVPDPPLHPHCRCRIVVWLGEWEGAGGGYPESLKREARRSIARGWSLESESNASRVRAAERLLRHGAGLPKTVEAYASRAVARGEFPRGRRFPG